MGEPDYVNCLFSPLAHLLHTVAVWLHLLYLRACCYKCQHVVGLLSVKLQIMLGRHNISDKPMVGGSFKAKNYI